MPRKKTADILGTRLPKWQREYRKTGRTTRMLTAALSLHRQGHDVVVYAISQDHARGMLHHAKRIAEGAYQGESVEESNMVLRIVPVTQGGRSGTGAPGVRFQVPKFDAINWHKMRVENGSRSIMIFDHATLEHLLSPALRAMHLWDESSVDEWTRTIEVPA